MIGCNNASATISETADCIPQDSVVIKEQNACFLLISKQDMTISVVDFKSNKLQSFPIACGRNYGNKRKVGDMKTPEGVYKVQMIQNASKWTHDFKDGKGEIKGAYGSHFIRLATPPHTGIGIHGTHDDSSIGTRATEGCIRLHNTDLVQLVKYVYINMPVIITGSDKDLDADCKIIMQSKQKQQANGSK